MSPAAQARPEGDTMPDEVLAHGKRWAIYRDDDGLRLFVGTVINNRSFDGVSALIGDEDAAAIAAVLQPQVAAATRAEIAATFRKAAMGRREQAGSSDSPDGKFADLGELMRVQALTLDAAARVAEGDIDPLYDWLPSHRWTPAMVDRLYGRKDTEGGEAA